MMTPVQSKIRDNAQALAERLIPALKASDEHRIKLDDSTVWLEDIHGSGFVAWAEDNTSWDSLTQTVYPEARQAGSVFDCLPTEHELERFVNACQHLTEK